QPARASWWFVAVLAALIAQLTRADGIVVTALVFGMALAAWRRGRIGGQTLAGVAGAYGICWGFWLARQYSVFGTPFPASFIQSLCLTHYRDILCYRGAPSIHGFLAQGVWKIVLDRGVALVTNLGIVLM